MSEGSLSKPDCVPQEAWDQSGPAARVCLVTLVQRLEALERRLGSNSGNSSLPPSTDGPGQTPVKAAKPTSGRRRGGQPGPAKRSRPLIPTDQCDRVEQHRPQACPAAAPSSAATIRSRVGIR